MKYISVIPLLLAAFPLNASAATGNVEFGGVVLSTCAIVISTPGVLALSNEGKTLSSVGGLGAPAVALLTATGTGFKIGVSSPTAFQLAPSGGDTGVSFDTSYSLSGVTSGLNVIAGTQTVLQIGATTLNVNLTATRPTIFPAGAYTARSVVTCE